MLIFDVLALIKNVQYVLKILLHLHHVIICWNKVSDTDAIMLHAFMLMHSQEMKNCFFLSLPFLEPNHGEYSTREHIRDTDKNIDKIFRERLPHILHLFFEK